MWSVFPVTRVKIHNTGLKVFKQARIISIEIHCWSAQHQAVSKKNFGLKLAVVKYCNLLRCQLRKQSERLVMKIPGWSIAGKLGVLTLRNWDPLSYCFRVMNVYVKVNWLMFIWYAVCGAATHYICNSLTRASFFLWSAYRTVMPVFPRLEALSLHCGALTSWMSWPTSITEVPLWLPLFPISGTCFWWQSTKTSLLSVPFGPRMPVPTSICSGLSNHLIASRSSRS